MTNEERTELANKVSELSTTIYVLSKKTTNKPLEDAACSLLADISTMLDSVEIILREQ